MKQFDWRQHESILMAFESAWQGSDPPSIDASVAAGPVEGRVSLLAELVMIDFEYRWKMGEVSNLDSYFLKYPELKHDRLTRDELLSHEFQVRMLAGKSPTATELNERFDGDESVANLNDRIGTQSSASLGAKLQPGALVGPYEIVRCIGTGAFARVYSAVDSKLQRPVALKFLTAGDVHSSARSRLRREAHAVAALKHPNVVPVFGAGNFQGHDYVVTRLVHGVDLDQWIKCHALAARDSVEIVAQLASALEHAHRCGVVHRDIKPANVMIENDVPQLLDFGLAHFGDNSQNLTHEGDVLGTPAFMPPEQADGRGWQADPRSDIYSLGAMLYLMLFGRLPFTGTTSEIISQILTREASIPRDAPALVSRDLQTIVLKCLEKEPTHRYQTAEELRVDLQHFLDGEPIVARPIGWAGRLVKWSRRRPAVAMLVLVILVLLAFGGGAATQLRHVISQRDRAQEAQQETRGLLAASAADAGRLAMQRGKLNTAVVNFEQALKRGYPDRNELLLSLVEAKFALRKIDESTQLVLELVADGVESRHVPALSMWRAELALEGQSEPGQGEALFDATSKMELSPVDAQYVRGMLAETSLSAVTHFQNATEIDPYHYRSRRMLIFMLFSLARFDESELQLRIARQLFPDDQDFLLLEGLVLAAGGEIEAAEEIVRDSNLDPESQARWRTFCRRLDEVSNQGVFALDNDNEAIVRLHELSQQFRQQFLPLIRGRNWRFPPKISRRFEAFTVRLPSLLTEGARPSAQALAELIKIHPEASLFMMHGALSLVGVSGEAVDRKNQIANLEKSRDSFRASLEYPGILKQSRQRAWMSVFTTSMTLALVHQHDLEHNRGLYAEASRQVDCSTVTSRNQARAFTIAALTANDLDEADRWIGHWMQLQKKDNASEFDVHWHQAILFKRHEDWLSVLQCCDRILEMDPMHEGAQGLRNLAVNRIKLTLKTESPKAGNGNQ